MRLGVSLASFATAAETTNVVDRAVELGSQAERLGLDSVWFAQLARIAERRQEAERHKPERGDEHERAHDRDGIDIGDER